MTDGKRADGEDCRRCGECCAMEIPLTLLDIHRIAEFRGLPDEEAFGAVVQDEISTLSSIFKIRKDKSGMCIFLAEGEGCTIHPAKPNICRFYNCSIENGRGVMSWTAACRQPSQRNALWEQSVAVMLTRAYIEKNQAVWNETDYRAALGSVCGSIPIRESQKLKLARDQKGRPMAMLYDCARCEKMGMRASETPVTLDDIRRISDHLKMRAQTFFRDYVDPAPSALTGGLKLKRGRNCVFFDPGVHCRIKAVRPLHCRFTPCPERASSEEMMNALFLGSGTVEEQYRHQVAMALTRNYVDQCGGGYIEKHYLRALVEIDTPEDASFDFVEFCRQIAKYRYVDDARRFYA